MTLSVNRADYWDSELPEYLAQYYRERATAYIESESRPGDKVSDLLNYLSDSYPFDTLTDTEIFFLWRSLGCPVGHAHDAGGPREMMVDALHDALEHVSIPDIILPTLALPHPRN